MPAKRDVGTCLVGSAKQRLATSQVKHSAAIERVNVVVGGHRADEEVPGHADALKRDPSTAAYLDAYDR
jgi:hypothetical protein